MSANNKIPIKDIIPTVERLISDIQEFTKRKAMVCGSIRRECGWVGDIDLLVECSPQEAYVAIRDGTRGRGAMVEGTWMSGGKNQCNILIGDLWEYGSTSVDIVMAGKTFWGAAMLHLTGSKEFNTWIRSVAKSQGYKLSQYGLFNFTERIAGLTEEQIFEALGVDFIQPKDRSPMIFSKSNWKTKK